MTYYGAGELAESLRTVRRNTLRIAEDVPEAQYGFKPTPDTRSVGQLLTHIAVSYRFQQQVHAIEHRTTIDGFDFPALFQRLGTEEAKPRTKAQIIDLLTREGDAWASWVEALSEDFLGERVQFPGDPPTSRSRFEMILSTKEHEMHHRGQMMLIERLLGIVPHLTRERQARMQARH
ncbi:MAG: DinB family protein [Acidobacteria bacterium]|nr:DinB family protein [Acidobacteriota bacterium]